MSKRAADRHTATAHSSLRRHVQNASFASLYRYGGRIYDPLTRFLFGGAWNRWRSSAIPFLPSGPILDVGCGTGCLVNDLNTMGYVALGVDRELSMLRSARSLPHVGSRLACGEAGALPFRAGSFDGCVATFPSRFVVQRQTLDEVVRVLRPGGTFVVVLSGYTEDWPVRRMPIRLALRLFYGQREAERLPDGELIAHPLLSGEWRWLLNGPDHVLVWIGERSQKQPGPVIYHSTGVVAAPPPEFRTES